MVLDKQAKTSSIGRLTNLHKLISEIKLFQPGIEHLPLFHSIDFANGQDGNTLGG